MAAGLPVIPSKCRTFPVIPFRILLTAATEGPMMSRRDWWIGVGVVALALLLHTAFPRYDWRQLHGPLYVQVDRWTGRTTLGAFLGVGGEWRTVQELQQDAQATAR